ncbi:ATP-dependent Clp protease adapter ClpS [Microbacterium dextranolyticum]|uniref:ATP-dependent Clp protease adapter protein ClpS n=1 Tax=Microbacterium dextranolyticum TaxID=36806 RepID=A0A9W6M646_9MICO|nr:ATP-dependent Clp protease adapter ClpS [Microbacterium dextranolyticum]GLJ96074.1 ATP-dependent Clp protease adapter protein ClpS [Microbacterium dextranolyticum]
MGVTAVSAVLPLEDVDLASASQSSRPWQAVVWNDPVNLMSYVVHVFREHFGYSREHAERLMLAVHHVGHAVVAEGAREPMEMHVQAMHDYGLWATVREGGS